MHSSRHDTTGSTMSRKIAVLTGTSSGIGLLCALQLARNDYQVIATMRDLARRQRLEDAARSAGVEGLISIQRLDITEFAAIPQSVADILKQHERIDVLVNNAGFAMSGFAEDLQIEEIRAQLETNFFGHVALTKAVLPAMRAQGAGHIIMISSVSGLVAQPVVSSYSASKFALEGWSEALRIETRSLGIRVVLVEPGAFKTDIWERNVRIGALALAPESPNRARAARFAQWVKTSVPKDDPQKVARLVARIAQNPNPRLRYRIGHDAHLQFWLKRLLPWKSYEKMLAKAVRID
jgi:NAD(P)-dependent dehydrogenase (short-subunit alcohol dehydrogenase family)